ncbi:MAG: dihydrodipicolinate synthase family protein [Lentisphaerae bacterium]|nr:dihydrodipicolinate synthase family protein [Lentisphaerota bacterium]
MDLTELSPALRNAFANGLVIPAHPLALDDQRHLDERYQRALTRYYLDAGAGGLAVGVHSTQLAIRDPEIGLYRPVLELAAETTRAWSDSSKHNVMLIAGVCGDTDQALEESALALELGYHAALLSLAAFRETPLTEVLAHCKRIAEVMPLVGFYMQPSVGGTLLPYAFWREFAEIENVIGIKMAPFNRYQTLDVVRAVAEAGVGDRVALYTGNDDNIVADLLTPYPLVTTHGPCAPRIVGGLLGHWAVWTRQAVALLEKIRTVRTAGTTVPTDLLATGIAITDANAAFFDAANRFAGCIPGIHEVLRRQGLMTNIVCLNPEETLSPGQAEEIDRVIRSYPELNDDAFVHENRDRWLTP